MRADKFLAEKYGSRSKAKEALSRGLVLRNGKPLAPSDEVFEGDGLSFAEGDGFVSAGGKKLERGLSRFGVSVENLVMADLGASTGGFTDCLLKRGARKVYCVDVGESQLDARLKEDPRVVVMDNTNARYLRKCDFPEPLDGVVCDLSFISLRLILPAVSELLQESGRAFVLFKPQFECEGKGLGKRGILPRSFHGPLLSDFYRHAAALGFALLDIVNAPVLPKKNVEYVVFLQKGGEGIGEREFLRRAEKIF